LHSSHVLDVIHWLRYTGRYRWLAVVCKRPEWTCCPVKMCQSGGLDAVQEADVAHGLTHVGM